MSRTRWGGQASRRERAKWAARLPVACCRCGRPVLPRPWMPADGWHPDHYPVRREAGGTETWPAHAECNLADGGRRGAAITNARRRAARPAVTGELARNIRGV